MSDTVLGWCISKHRFSTHWSVILISIDLNFALGWNRINLGIVGIWPDPLESKRQNMFSRFRFLVACFFLLAFLCIPQSINLILIWGDVNLMAENLSTINMLTAYAIIKAIVLWRQRKGIYINTINFLKDIQIVTHWFNTKLLKLFFIQL